MRLRRTMMYVPGNNPGLIGSAGIFGADGIILDLEDSVSISEKDAARNLVKRFLLSHDFGKCEVTVRVNHIDTPYGLDDLQEIVPCKPDGIRMPKCESAEEIRKIDEIMSEIEEKNGIEVGSVKLFAILETAKGVFNAYEIATASKRITALVFGAEDYTASMRTSRTKSGEELFYARSQIVLAARVAGVDALDTVFPDINDIEGLIKETKLIKQLGFDGKSVIHPSQIDPIHEVFTPTKEEIEKARRIIKAYKEAMERKSGVVALDGRMIDAPVVTRAKRTLFLAGELTEEV